jgi:hypothetical protein
MAAPILLPPDFVAGARQAPFRGARPKIAHTLEYDATIIGDYGVPIERAKAVPVPTIIVDGGAASGSGVRRRIGSPR